MSTNPWMLERLAAGRMEELERAARVQAQAVVDDSGAPTATASRGSLTRHVGVLLISLGRRLAEPESFPAAFEAHRR